MSDKTTTSGTAGFTPIPDEPILPLPSGILSPVVPELSDDQRWSLYNQCTANEGFNILDAINTFEGMTGDLGALAQVFIDGLHSDGCDTFLTPAQIAQRNQEQWQAEHPSGNPGQG